MRSLFALLAVVGFSLPLSAAEDAAVRPKATKVLLIGHDLDHPFGSHMYLHECGLLGRCLEQTEGVTAVVSNRWPKDPKVLEGVTAIAVYSSPGANVVLHGAHAADAQRLLAEGVGYTAIHWATGAEGKELGERYLGVLGGWFHQSFGGLDVSPSRIIQIDTEHPICRGWKNYDLRDEWYLETRLAPGAQPLLKVPVKNKEQVVAWTFERPDSRSGRSFGITLGHFHDNFGIESFRRTIVNGILWTAHRQIPSSGASVKIEPSDLELGPDPREKK
ncbi:MAG: ThuA domain-containing protein [Planctomycetaceae bacterium]